MSKRRLSIFMFLLTMFALGSIILAACARPGSPTASSGTPGSNGGGSSSGAPTVHMDATNFVQSTVTVPKGQKLMLVDDGQYLHILSNGSWVNGTAVPKKEAGAPTLNNVQVNGNNLEVGPFTTAGTFHIYCSIHTNMNLDVTVK
jgi:plastocyanin